MADRLSQSERSDLRAYLRELRAEHSDSVAVGRCAPLPACDCSTASEIDWAQECLKSGRMLAANER